MTFNRQRADRSPLPATCALACAVVFGPRPAQAFHSAEQRLTDDTADTLQRGTIRLGLFKAEYAPLRSLQLGTYPLPWLLRIPNLHLKWRFFRGKQLSFATRLGYFGFDTKNLDAIDEQKQHARLTVLPFELSGTWRIDRRASIGLSLISTGVFIEGEMDVEALNGTWQGGASNLQSLSTFELRVSRVTALLLQTRFLSFQLANLSGDVVLQPDEFTTIEIHGAGRTDTLDFRGAYSATLAALFSWEHFNLRLGVGYGNYNVPGLNFMLPQRSLFPELDVYWIF